MHELKRTDSNSITLGLTFLQQRTKCFNNVYRYQLKNKEKTTPESDDGKHADNVTGGAIRVYNAFFDFDAKFFLPSSRRLAYDYLKLTLHYDSSKKNNMSIY